MLAVAATVLTLVALDRLIDAWDLNYHARRDQPDAERSVVREEFAYRVRTNSLGYRDARLPVPKTARTRRIVVLGDSFTYGHGVEEPDCYPRRLEARLRERDPRHVYEVVNLGFPGSNPRDYLHTLREIGLVYEPDVVVVGLMGNDVRDLFTQRELGTQHPVDLLTRARHEVLHPRPAWRRLPTVLLPGLYPFVWQRWQGLRAGRAEVERGAAADSPAGPRVSAAVAPAPWREVLVALAERYGVADRIDERFGGLAQPDAARVRDVLVGAADVGTEEGEESYWRLVALLDPDLWADAVLLPPRYDGAWDWMERLLSRIADEARDHGAKLLVAFVPASHQVTATSRPTLAERGFRWDARTLTDTGFVDRLAAFCAATGIEFVDLLRPLRAADRDDLYYPRDGHWTPAGHRLAAELVVDAVLRGDPG
jgi:hypothetical protein